MKVVTKIPGKACCGSKNLTVIFDSSYSVSLAAFLQARKFYVMESMIKNGCLYTKMNHLIITGTFGSSKMDLRCQGQGCEFQVQSFLAELEKYEAGKISAPTKK